MFVKENPDRKKKGSLGWKKLLKEIFKIEILILARIDIDKMTKSFKNHQAIE